MINTQLAKLESEGKRIKVGLVGAGRFGASIVSQISQMKGMEISIIADIKPQKAIDAYSHYGMEASGICETNCVDVANQKIENKKAVITTDGVLVTRCMVDVVVEATGVPNSGAIATQVQLRRGFAESVRQTETHRNPKNINKTAAPRRQLQRLVRISLQIRFRLLALVPQLPNPTKMRWHS